MQTARLAGFKEREMTPLITFAFFAGTLAVLLLHSGRAFRHPASNEGALIPAPIPGLLVPPGAFPARRSSQVNEILFELNSVRELRGSRILCQCRRSPGGSNRT
jgi:hypothetical protein